METKVEQVTKRHKTPWLKQWTLCAVEIAEDKAEDYAEKVRKSLETKHSAWHADYKNEKWHYIIFPDKIFKIDLNSPLLYKEARRYGISLGIPEYQVEFAPNL